MEDFKQEIDNTVVVRDFNTPRTSTDRSSRQKINKTRVTLNGTLDQMDLIDIYRIFHPKATEYTFFSSAHGTFSKTDHSLGHKICLNKFRNSEFTSRNFSEHNDTKLDINYNKKMKNIQTDGG